MTYCPLRLKVFQEIPINTDQWTRNKTRIKMNFILATTVLAIFAASTIASPLEAIQEASAPSAPGISLRSANAHEALIASRKKDLDYLKAEILAQVNMASTAINSGKQSIRNKITPAVKTASVNIENARYNIQSHKNLADINNNLRESTCWASKLIIASLMNANDIDTSCNPTWEYDAWYTVRDDLKELVDAVDTFGNYCGSLFPSASKAAKVDECITNQINYARNLARSQNQDLTYRINGAQKVAIYCVDTKQKDIATKLSSLQFCSD